MCMFFSNPCPSCSVSCCCPSPLCASVCQTLTAAWSVSGPLFQTFFPRCHPCLDCCVSQPLTLWVTPQFVSYGALEKLPADRTNKPLRCLFFLDFLYVLSAAQNEETWKNSGRGSMEHIPQRRKNNPVSMCWWNMVPFILWAESKPKHFWWLL